MQRKLNGKLIILTAIIFSLIVILGIVALPYINLLSDPVNQQTFKEWVSSLGAWGWVLVLFLMIAQIVIAFLPGEPIELFAGVLYGTFGGLFLCLLGSVIASSFIFMISKKFGPPLLNKLFKKNMLDEFDFLKDAKKLETIVFIVFLIPGTPKDMLTYVVGTSSMSLMQFIIISTFARIPSVITSTIVGSTMRQGQWEIAALVLVLTAVLGFVGLKYKERMMDFCKRLAQRFKGQDSETKEKDLS